MKHNMHLITSQRVFLLFFLLNMRNVLWGAAGLRQSSAIRSCAASSFLFKRSQATFYTCKPKRRRGHLQHVVVAQYDRDSRAQGGQRLSEMVV